METEYINQLQLITNYSNPVPTTSHPLIRQGPNGKLYQQLGIAIKSYGLADRVWIGIQVLAITLFSGGIALLFENVQEEWQTFWTGKRIVLVYTLYSSPPQNAPCEALFTTQAIVSFKRKTSDETVCKKEMALLDIPDESFVASQQLADLVTKTSLDSANPHLPPQTALPNTNKAVELSLPSSVLESLIDFYVNQQARLRDLKTQLETAEATKHPCIERAIITIERSGIHAAQIALRAQLALTSAPSLDELAHQLGKSAVTVRGLLLGETYAKVIIDNMDPMIGKLISFDSKLYGAYAPLIEELKEMSGSRDLETIAMRWQVSQEKAAKHMKILWMTAQTMRPSELQEIEEAIDEQVAHLLAIDKANLAEWIRDMEEETELNSQLTRLGEERRDVYPTEYVEAAQQTCRKHGISSYFSGMWMFFSKGECPPSPLDDRAENQWKLFLNPKASTFQSTLDRALRALASMPHILGKIVDSDTRMRKSQETALNDPCEPKLLFYFRGTNSADDFKRAVELLEREFVDADLVGAPMGIRVRGNKLEEQWGPSFTKQRNRLLFYTQGGYTESSRDLAVASGRLDEDFEGENYYLHKGSHDPLTDLPSFTLSMDEFLKHMEAHQEWFSHPFHMVKLQNLLNRLKQDPNPSKQVIDWQAKIGSLMQAIASNMSLPRQAATMRVFMHREGMQEANSAISTAFYTDLNEPTSPLDLDKGPILAKLKHLERESLQRIARLKSHLSTGEALSFEVLNDIPKAFAPIFLEKAEMKNALFEEGMKQIQQLAMECKVVLSKAAMDELHDELKQGMVVCDNDKLMLMKRVKTDFGRFTYPITLPCLLRGLPHTFPEIEPLYALAKTKKEESPLFIPLSASVPSFVNLRSALEIALRKLENVHSRQQRRLEAYARGETVVIPQRFHTTNASNTASILQSGLEAIHARSGFGAFFSTEPELRYGDVTLGLPKIVELDSKAMTLFHRENSDAIKSSTQVWAGLRDFIHLNPQAVRLRHRFSEALKYALIKSTMHLRYSAQSIERMRELEERILQNFNRSVVLRAERTGDAKQEVTWSLYYRALWTCQPTGEVIKITHDAAWEGWATQMLDGPIQAIGISSEQQKQRIKSIILEHFQVHFKAAYCQQGAENPYEIRTPLQNDQPRASVIAADDEFKDIYQQEREFASSRSDDVKPIQTLSEIEIIFATNVLNGTTIELIPLSEQLIEGEMLMAVDSKVPKAWNIPVGQTR